MKSRFLIIIGIIITGIIIALAIGTIEYQTKFNQNCHDDNGKVTGFLQCMLIREDYALSYDENAQYLVEELFMDVLEEIYDDNLQVKTLVVIKSKNNESSYDNYCGFAHLENQEVWFDADFAENQLIQGVIVDPPSPYCTDDDHSCFCDLQEKLTGERKSYEEFFRQHVSETCPVIPMPSDDVTFDPTTCTWTAKVSFDDPVYSVPFSSSENEYHIDPIYIENPNNPGELILDIDAMQLVQKILKDCGLPKYEGFAYGLEYSNGTHYIDNNSCKWQKIK